MKKIQPSSSSFLQCQVHGRVFIDIVICKLHEDPLAVWTLANGLVCQSGHEIPLKRLPSTLLVLEALSLAYSTVLRTLCGSTEVVVPDMRQAPSDINVVYSYNRQQHAPCPVPLPGKSKYSISRQRSAMTKPSHQNAAKSC